MEYGAVMTCDISAQALRVSASSLYRGRCGSPSVGSLHRRIDFDQISRLKSLHYRTDLRLDAFEGPLSTCP